MRYVDFGEGSFVGLGESRAASTAGGGTALTSTAALILLPAGTKHVQLIPRNFAGAAVIKCALTPYLAVLKLAAALSAIADESADMQDGAAGTTIALDGYLYVGSHLPVRGVAVTIAAVNAVASVLTVRFGAAAGWTAFTNGAHGYVDGTIAGGASMAQSGQVVWPTLPTTWIKQSLRTLGADPDLVPRGLIDEPMYWTRWEWSTQLAATVTASAMLALARSTAYAEMVATLGFEGRIIRGLGGHAAVEALTDAGTASLIVNVFTDPMGMLS